MNKIKSFILGTLTAAGILFGNASSLEARVLHVPSDYKTIQEAVNSSAKNDTISIAQGNHHDESIIINNKLGLYIQGEKIVSTLLSEKSDSPNGTYFLNTFIGDTIGISFKIISSNNINLENISFIGGLNPVYIENSTVSLKDCNFAFSKIGILMLNENERRTELKNINFVNNDIAILGLGGYFIVDGGNIAYQDYSPEYQKLREMATETFPYLEISKDYLHQSVSCKFNREEVQVEIPKPGNYYGIITNGHGELSNLKFNFFTSENPAENTFIIFDNQNLNDKTILDNFIKKFDYSIFKDYIVK